MKSELIIGFKQTGVRNIVLLPGVEAFPGKSSPLEGNKPGTHSPDRPPSRPTGGTLNPPDPKNPR